MKLGLGADELLTTTRAVRRRLNLRRRVEMSVVRECLEIAIQAPSGSNRQQWSFIVVTDRKQKEELAEVYRQGFRTYVQARQRAGLETDPIYKSVAYLAAWFEEVPCYVVPVVRGRAERLTSAHDQAAFWGGIAPAVWSFMLAARERGIGTAWTTMHLQDERRAAEILGIPYERYTQAALIPVAYTRGTKFSRARRAPIDELIHIDRWDSST